MNVLITGASNGIGHELAKTFTAHKVNRLILISRNKQKLEQLKQECASINAGTHVDIVVRDLQDILNQDAEFDIVPDHLDILINNAGTLITKEFNDISVPEMQYVFNVNLFAPAKLIQLLLPKMGGINRSHIINIGSMAGFQGSSKFKGLSIYSASKGALATLTESLAVELFPKNIAVNCLSLGAVQTDMLAIAFPGYKAPLKPSEMASFIADFAIHGSRYFNGKILPVALTNPG